VTARSALEKFAAVQMIDVHLPTTDGRELLLTRYTQPEPELQLLIRQLKLQLPPQPPPKLPRSPSPTLSDVVKTFCNRGKNVGTGAFFSCSGSTRSDSLRMCRRCLPFPG
jgi:hypothetical protein